LRDQERNGERGLGRFQQRLRGFLEYGSKLQLRRLVEHGSDLH
jgi:hypothetical protein